ncbi:phage holin family protein [Enterobacter ludwigii]|uniref:phage holin family protein n=1 Tax=Enterobacter ludwigii TaxID=299767 RepID=UPI003076497C
MQNFIPPGGWGVVLHFIHENRLAIQGALTAFFIALLFSLWDGEGWKRSLNAGLICGFVALAVVSLFDQLGVADIRDCCKRRVGRIPTQPGNDTFPELA